MSVPPPPYGSPPPPLRSRTVNPRPTVNRRRTASPRHMVSPRPTALRRGAIRPLTTGRGTAGRSAGPSPSPRGCGPRPVAGCGPEVAVRPPSGATGSAPGASTPPSRWCCSSSPRRWCRASHRCVPRQLDRRDVRGRRVRDRHGGRLGRHPGQARHRRPHPAARPARRPRLAGRRSRAGTDRGVLPVHGDPAADHRRLDRRVAQPPGTARPAGAHVRGREGRAADPHRGWPASRPASGRRRRRPSARPARSTCGCVPASTGWRDPSCCWCW